ncbi:hypothetical protein L917_03179 [Phytophthora nicotianae]|uniref:Uncharacterized protein n=1 Tax=Phytophthora nicotianae TaxID=4792 RepID=W2LRN4_PHYNI|nr:hypothetical protein L917_03179 [Phytophthora nicotianae]
MRSPPIQYPLTLTSVKECAQDAEVQDGPRSDISFCRVLKTG